MSIVTKSGDAGTTGLMYNRRVPKHDPRVEAYGCVDELNAALGLARATVRAPTLRRRLLAVQRNLISVMGELATTPADLPRYKRAGFRTVGPELTAELETLVARIEPQLGPFRDWAVPGETATAAALDFARTVCRRAERRVCALQAAGELMHPHVVVFLNRLADVLWLLAREHEAQARLAKRRRAKRRPSGAAAP
jgi:cob(I)alamin adenosyltransferase